MIVVVVRERSAPARRPDAREVKRQCCSRHSFFERAPPPQARSTTHSRALTVFSPRSPWTQAASRCGGVGVAGASPPMLRVRAHCPLRPSVPPRPPTDTPAAQTRRRWWGGGGGEDTTPIEQTHRPPFHHPQKELREIERDKASGVTVSLKGSSLQRLTGYLEGKIKREQKTARGQSGDDDDAGLTHPKPSFPPLPPSRPQGHAVRGRLLCGGHRAG